MVYAATTCIPYLFIRYVVPYVGLCTYVCIASIYLRLVAFISLSERSWKPAMYAPLAQVRFTAQSPQWPMPGSL